MQDQTGRFNGTSHAEDTADASADARASAKNMEIFRVAPLANRGERREGPFQRMEWPSVDLLTKFQRSCRVYRCGRKCRCCIGRSTSLLRYRELRSASVRVHP